MRQANRAYYTLDREMRLIEVGPRALALWGKERSDCIGHDMLEVFPALRDGPVHAALLQAMTSFRPARLKVHSAILNRKIDLEIYPVHGLLQVTFAPVDHDNP